MLTRKKYKFFLLLLFILFLTMCVFGFFFKKNRSITPINIGGGRGTHFLINKAIVIDIISDYKVICEILPRFEFPEEYLSNKDIERNNHDLFVGDIVEVRCVACNEQIFNTINTLYVGNVIEISRYDTSKIDNSGDIPIVDIVDLIRLD